MSTPDETRQDTAITDAVPEDHEPTLANIPAIGGWDLTRQLPSSGPVPEPEPARAPAIHCPSCGETFACAGFGGKALFLADALHAAALAAGWAESEGRWTCSVCLAGIAGPLYGPEREPVPSLPAPDTDPYKQYQDARTEIDAREDRFWQDINPSNTAAGERTHDRIRDSYCNIAHLLAEAFYAGDPVKEEEIRREMFDMSAKYQRLLDETMRMRAVA